MQNSFSRVGIEKQRDQKLTELERGKRAEKLSIKAQVKESVSKLEGEVNVRIIELQGQLASIDGSISDLESQKSQFPVGSKEYKAIDKQLKMLQKHRSIIKYQIEKLKYQLKSQRQTIEFNAYMKEQMANMRYANQKSMLLRVFAERIMQVEKNQRSLQNQVSAQGDGGASFGGGGKSQLPHNKEGGKLMG